MKSHLPTHVAFIMDGNGRWAQKRGLARLKGHAAGIETVRNTCEELVSLGVQYATFYTFSTENWKRPWDEVSGLFSLMRAYFNSELNTIIEKGIRIRFIGDRGEGTSRSEAETNAKRNLPADILKLMNEVEAKTAHNTKLHATFAVNYSGRDELIRAARKLASEGTEITSETFDTALDTHGLPDPDFVIRTSGEQRISNFLLWQIAYAELYFSDVSWPDFTATHLQAAMSSYVTRQRRFGALPSADPATDPISSAA